MSQMIEVLKCKITTDSPEEAERILAQHEIGTDSRLTAPLEKCPEAEQKLKKILLETLA